MSQLYGKAMVEKETYYPVGFCAAWFEPGGQVSIQASFGNYLRTYPKDILASMVPLMKDIRDHGVKRVYGIADRDIRGSTDLIRWFDGKDTGHRSTEPPIGALYEIDMHSERMNKLIKRRG